MTPLMEAPQVVTRRRIMRDVGQIQRVRADAAEWLTLNGAEADKNEAKRVLFWLKPREVNHG